MAAPPPASSASGLKLKFKLGGPDGAPPAPPADPTPGILPSLPPVPLAQPAQYPSPSMQSSAPPPTPPPAPLQAITSVEAAGPSSEAKPVLSSAHPAPVAVPVTQPSQQQPPASLSRPTRPPRKEVIDLRKPVSPAHYTSLKAKYEAAQETADQATFALHRAQRLIVQLRDENAALLDNLISLRHSTNPSSSLPPLPTDSFSLLHPPPLPSLADRPRPRPRLDTATDFSSSAYDRPLGPPPPPAHLAPRLRSPHFLAALEADRRRAGGASDAAGAAHAAVAVLGLQGARVAENVERALAGEAVALPTSGAGVAEGVKGGKRRRSSAAAEGVSGKRAKEGSGSPPAAKAVELPNPFSLPNPFEMASVAPAPGAGQA